MIIFWIIAKSAVFPIIVVSKNKTIYTVGMVIYWNTNVNILIFRDTDFLLSWAVSSNHQNENKRCLKCFTLHVMNLKYMKVSHFEIGYKKEIRTFSPYSYFFRCTCKYTWKSLESQGNSYRFGTSGSWVNYDNFWVNITSENVLLLKKIFTNKCIYLIYQCCFYKLWHPPKGGYGQLTLRKIPPPSCPRNNSDRRVD